MTRADREKHFQRRMAVRRLASCSAEPGVVPRASSIEMARPLARASQKRVTACDTASGTDSTGLGKGRSATEPRLTRVAVSGRGAAEPVGDRLPDRAARGRALDGDQRKAQCVSLAERGVEPGGVPPFGNLFALRVIADPTLFENEKIIFNAGDRGFSVAMRSEDYRRLVNPEVVEIV